MGVFVLRKLFFLLLIIYFQLCVNIFLPAGDICQWQLANASLMRPHQICDNIKFSDLGQPISYLALQIQVSIFALRSIFI